RDECSVAGGVDWMSGTRRRNNVRGAAAWLSGRERGASRSAVVFGEDQRERRHALLPSSCAEGPSERDSRNHGCSGMPRGRNESENDESAIIATIVTRRILISVAVLSLAGRWVAAIFAQQPPPAPIVQPFNDGNDWVVVRPFTYTIGQTTYRITVPAGFVTDFASIPAPMRGFLSPTGQEGRAAIIHDYLYWNQPCTREQADWVL